MTPGRERTADEAGAQKAPETAEDRGLPVGWIAAAAVVVMVGVMVALVVRRDGAFTYPLDDTYIHLRIAQNLRHGVLGINPGEFASATSSPLWSAVLTAAISVVGARIGVPLVLATICAAAVPVGADRWARSRAMATRERVLLATALVLIVPLPILGFMGMEHALQVALALLLVVLGVRVIDGQGGAALAGAAAVAAAGAAVRPEVLFVLGPLVLWAWARRRWGAGALLATAGVVPLAVMALIYRGQGWPLLPASVLVKSGLVRSGVDKVLPHPGLHAFARSRLLFVLLACLIAWVAGRRAVGPTSWPRAADVWASVFVAATAIHIGYAQLGWLYRYEAYLVALGICATALCVHAQLGAHGIARWQVAALAVCGLIALLLGLRAIVNPVQSSHEIHEQQVQMARFVRHACPQCRVAVNDVGVVAFDADVPVTDVYGLANRKVLDAKRDGTWDTTTLERIVKDEGAGLAMVYVEQNWVPEVPDSWQPLGTWTFPPRPLGFNVVSLYSTDPSKTDELRQAFRDFHPEGDVTVRS